MSDNMNKINDEALKQVSGGKTPGMESRVLFRMYNGEKVDTTGLVVHKDGLDWYEIYLDDNVLGWVAGCLIGY